LGSRASYNREDIVVHVEGTFEGYDGRSLYYQRWQPDGAPKAVLMVLHGFGEHSGRYGNVVDWFVPRGYAVHAFDQRGHGRSSGKRGYVESWAEYRDDLKAFLDLSHNGSPDVPLFLVGHSQGGLIVLDYVLHDPSRLAGVVSSAPILGQPGISPILVPIAKLLSRVWPSFTMEVRLDVTALARDVAVQQAYADDPLVHGKGTARLGTELTATMSWVRAHAAEVALPCLVVLGGADRLCPPDATRSFFKEMTIADRELIEYEGHYHEVFNDLGKETVLADVERWLESHL
jgi:alpha-beta hydrolase superfamily lysophospholipase